MPPPKHLFRAVPPKELVEQSLRRCGLLGLHDLRWFSKEELSLEGFEEWLVEVEPYYLPCKARRFFYARRGLGAPAELLITVLRHLVSAHDYKLNTQERLYKDVKQTLYQIVPCDPFQGLVGLDSHTVEFT